MPVDYRESRVLSKLVDIQTLANYCVDRFNDVGAPLGRGQSIAVPNLTSLTVYPDGSVPRLAADRANPAPATVLVNINHEPWIPVQLPKVSSIENLAGNWDTELASNVMIQLRNEIDRMILDDYIAGTLCWAASGASTYQRNVDSDSLDASDLLVSRGLMLRNRGSYMRNLMWIFDPLASAAVMGLPGWQNQVVTNQYGADSIGRIYGIELIESQAVRTGGSHAISTAVVAGNVATIVFATNPGLLVGMPASTTLLAANADDAVIATVSADGLTITIPIVHADGSIMNAGAQLVEDSAANILMDRTHLYKALQAVPSLDIVKDPDTTGWILQASALLGFIGRAGRATVIRTPDDAI